MILYLSGLLLSGVTKMVDSVISVNSFLTRYSSVYFVSCPIIIQPKSINMLQAIFDFFKNILIMIVYCL
jgi:hypothetical protein